MDIAIVLYPQFTALDAMGPLEVLSSIPGARVRFVAEQTGSITNDTGVLSVLVATALAELPHPDIILVPGGPGCHAAMESEPLLAWLRAAHATSRWTTSVCTGSLILGAAGLLQGLRATTHWGAQSQLALFGATYAPERFVPQGKVATAAGVSAGIDMALWLAGELAGQAIAREVQLVLEYDPAPPFIMPTPPTRLEDLADEHRQIMAHRAGKREQSAPSQQTTNEQA